MLPLIAFYKLHQNYFVPAALRIVQCTRKLRSTAIDCRRKDADWTRDRFLASVLKTTPKADPIRLGAPVTASAYNLEGLGNFSSGGGPWTVGHRWPFYP
jgi:hypothetical protein